MRSIIRQPNLAGSTRHNVSKPWYCILIRAEIETIRFYEQMTNEMPPEFQQMFARFLEIEENHIAAVQFELDYLTQSGYWFDFKEYDMEDL